MILRVLLVVVMMVSTVQAITLEWDAPATGAIVNYNVYRKAAPGVLCSATVVPESEFELIGSVAAPQLFTADNNPVIGANYYYVTASNVQEESLPSNQICFQRMQKPSPPQKLRFR